MDSDHSLHCNIPFDIQPKDVEMAFWILVRIAVFAVFVAAERGHKVYEHRRYG